MTAYELMGKIVEESDKGTEFYKELSATTDTKDKLKCIQMLMEHFDCGFDEARIVMDNVLNREPVLPDPDPIREAKAAEAMRKPTCPICGSTNLTKLSNVGKAAKVGFFGIFGAGDLGKTWKCKNCGSKF